MHYHVACWYVDDATIWYVASSNLEMPATASKKKAIKYSIDDAVQVLIQFKTIYSQTDNFGKYWTAGVVSDDGEVLITQELL